MLGTLPDTDTRCPLPPGLTLPLLLPRGPLSSNSRSPYVVRPRADAASAPSAGATPTPTSGSDTSAVSSSASHNGSRSDGQGVSMPRPNAGVPLGIGAGGTLFFGGVPPSRAAAMWPFGRRKVRPAGSGERARRRILIMMSMTGGGHKASADALKAAFTEKYGDEYEIIISDIWAEHTPSPFNQFPATYGWMVKHSFVWWASYNMLQPKWVHVPYLRMIHMISNKMIGEYFEELQADLVVSVHPLMQHVPLRILRSLIRSGLIPPTNFATVVTDFTTCHNTWFHPEVTRCFVPTEFTRNLALKNGLKEEQVIQHGLPIRPAFAKPLPAKAAMKTRLKMDKNLPAILLIGGGEGMGKLEDIVDGIGEKVGDICQVVVCCGRNKTLVEKMKAKRYASGMQVIPLGFTDNIHEWMHACDCIVTKAGPGTMAEALIMGLPMILSGNVPGQEEGNVTYVVDNAVGAFETRPDRIADILCRWLGPEREEFKQMSERAKALGRPEAVYKIVEDLARLAYVPDFTYGPSKVHHLAAQYAPKKLAVA